MLLKAGLVWEQRVWLPALHMQARAQQWVHSITQASTLPYLKEPEASEPVALYWQTPLAVMGNSQESPVIVEGFKLLNKAQRTQAHMPQCSHLTIHTPGLQGHSLAQNDGCALLQSTPMTDTA